MYMYTAGHDDISNESLPSDDVTQQTLVYSLHFRTLVINYIPHCELLKARGVRLAQNGKIQVSPDQISVYFGSGRQNVLKSNRNKMLVYSIYPQSDPILIVI